LALRGAGPAFRFASIATEAAAPPFAGFEGWAARYNPVMEAGEILKRALTLPDEERAKLAARLIDSLDPTIDENVEAAWHEEIARRIEEVENGKVKNHPLERGSRKRTQAPGWPLSR
jgi:putative addiction module component (TIGR02574 family)